MQLWQLSQVGSPLSLENNNNEKIKLRISVIHILGIFSIQVPPRVYHLLSPPCTLLLDIRVGNEKIEAAMGGKERV